MLKRLARTIFPSLPILRWKAEEQWAAAQHMGTMAVLRLWLARNLQARLRSNRLARIKLAGFDYPLYFRPSGSDPKVIWQVFHCREYEPVGNLMGIDTIIDCGANIGCTTFFLLHRYPHARAVVVEPDAGNMALCRKNLAPFRNRVIFVQGGVWSSSGKLVVETGGDGKEWAFRVRLAKGDEPFDVAAHTIGELMTLGDFETIDLLKVDIEGAEAELFSTGNSNHRPIDWLARTRNIAIEVHSAACEDAVREAISDLHFQEMTSGELLIVTNIRANREISEVNNVQ